jgi:hypothetical protein
MNNGVEQKFVSIAEFDILIQSKWELGGLRSRYSKVSETVKKEGLYNNYPYHMKEGELF